MLVPSWDADVVATRATFLGLRSRRNDPQRGNNRCNEFAHGSIPIEAISVASMIVLTGIGRDPV
jgi:hypothetical protein